jgi:hypothetical protein
MKVDCSQESYTSTLDFHLVPARLENTEGMQRPSSTFTYTGQTLADCNTKRNILEISSLPEYCQPTSLDIYRNDIHRPRSNQQPSSSRRI